ncbi:flagellar hook-length control protein FliK [Ramlibacter sp. H39-3-26]|uniref:flagellar hook-length control protein FliK n=1 Tax=Curvibacter soli TaxID=3031331 RepID=UPI0023DC66E1|nr:flagellar hook-length control protein FliK [Ramlibacter sp. H39-3-26]MDF1484212.1 flagellar hook-length control protein FliK [Ramlibacter sp. H39-3-26]
MAALAAMPSAAAMPVAGAAATPDQPSADQPSPGMPGASGDAMVVFVDALQYAMGLAEAPAPPLSSVGIDTGVVSDGHVPSTDDEHADAAVDAENKAPDSHADGLLAGNELLSALSPPLAAVLAAWQAERSSASLPVAGQGSGEAAAVAAVQDAVPGRAQAPVSSQAPRVALGMAAAVPQLFTAGTEPPLRTAAEAAQPELTLPHADGHMRKMDAALGETVSQWAKGQGKNDAMPAAQFVAASSADASTMGVPPAAAPADNAAAASSGKVAQAGAQQHATALVEALGDRIKLQVNQGSERAVIRLDPPMMGRLEIMVRHEGGTLQVQLTASHGDVARQLQAVSDTMRQDLTQRHFGDVSVVVAHGGEREPGGRQRQGESGRPSEETPGKALAEAEDGAAPKSFFTLA